MQGRPRLVLPCAHGRILTCSDCLTEQGPHKFRGPYSEIAISCTGTQLLTGQKYFVGILRNASRITFTSHHYRLTMYLQEGWLPPTKRASAAKIN